MRSFSEYNPIVTAIWFFCVTGIAMFCNYPVLMLISLAGAIVFFIMRNGLSHGKTHLFFWILFAVLALANTDSALDGSIYNVATDEEITIIALVELCAKKMGIKKPVIEFNGYRASDPERRLLSTEKIRARTAWQPVVNLDKGLDECIENYLKN